MDVIPSSGIIVIEDNLECRGTSFLLAILKVLLKKVKKALLICDELTQNCLDESFIPAELSKLEILFDEEICHRDNGNENDITDLCREKLQKDDSMLILDSLSSCFTNYGSENTIQLLSHIHTEFKIPIVALIHNDCINNEQMNQLHWLASTWYKLSWCENNTVVETRTIKTSGEIRRKTSILNISKDLALKFTPNNPNANAAPSNLPPNEQRVTEKITPNLTFNVGLKESELMAKKNLLLPYIKTQTEKETGKVIYVPDKEDDLDEEDPDADLDF